jgi:hypothetical protein
MVIDPVDGKDNYSQPHQKPKIEPDGKMWGGPPGGLFLGRLCLRQWLTLSTSKLVEKKNSSNNCQSEKEFGQHEVI